MLDKRYPSKVIREKCGGWSAMTEYRNWQRGFPKPEKINGRNYYTQQQVDVDIPEWFERRNQNKISE
jgi:hypothetical protein